MVVVHAAAGANAARARRLEKAHTSLVKNQDRMLERWFGRYDLNHNNVLEASELVNLLKELYTEVAVDEAVVRSVMTPKVSVEGVSKKEVMAVVKRFGGYVRHHAQLHELLGRHSEGRTSVAARSQLLALLGDFAKSSGLKDTAVAEEDANFVSTKCGVAAGASSATAFEEVSAESLLSSIALWQACRLEVENAPEKSSSACAIL